jgi:hypothetical protein
MPVAVLRRRGSRWTVGTPWNKNAEQLVSSGKLV